MLDVSVVIPTYRRPGLLKAAVQSVLSQAGFTATVELVVVDNDPERSAEPLIADMALSAALPVRYVSEKRAGISYARNSGVAVAQGRYVVFLDDDEVAESGWLSSLLATAHDYEADIVVGPVRPFFPRGAVIPRYAQVIYERDARVPTGSVVQSGGIGNALLLRDRCLAGAVPFDPKLGLSGGEDALFLGRLRDQGRKCVWCAEAAATEFVPADRLEPAYLLRRAFRGGQTTAYVPSALDHPHWHLVLRWMAIGAAQVCVYGPWGLVLRLLGRDEWLSVMAKAASGLGKLLWHPALHIRNYRLDPVSKAASGLRRS